MGLGRRRVFWRPIRCLLEPEWCGWHGVPILWRSGRPQWSALAILRYCGRPVRDRDDCPTRGWPHGRDLPGRCAAADGARQRSPRISIRFSPFAGRSGRRGRSVRWGTVQRSTVPLAIRGDASGRRTFSRDEWKRLASRIEGALTLQTDRLRAKSPRPASFRLLQSTFMNIGLESDTEAVAYFT